MAWGCHMHEAQQYSTRLACGGRGELVRILDDRCRPQPCLPALNILSTHLDLYELFSDYLIQAHVFGFLGRKTFLETIRSTGQKEISSL